MRIQISNPNRIWAPVRMFLLLFVFGTLSFTPDSNAQCDPNLTINNNGVCPIEIYLWLNTGDILQTTLNAGGSWGVSTHVGAMYRATSAPAAGNWNNLQFDQEYTVTSACHQTSPL